MVRSHIHNRGIATLEFAVSATFLLFLVTGAVGLIDYVRRVRAINETIENSLIDDGIKPLTLLLSGTDSTISLRTSELESYLRDVVGKARDRLLPLVEDGGSQAAGLYIEAGYAQIDIDSTTGALINIHSAVIPEVARYGSLSIPASLAHETNIDDEFARLANEQMAGGVGAALYAIPTGLFGGSNTSHQYLSKSVLVGLRAFITLRGGLAGRFMPLIDDNPVVFGIKAITLRGELE